MKEFELHKDVSYLNLLDDNKTCNDAIILEPLSAAILKKI